MNSYLAMFGGAGTEEFKWFVSVRTHDKRRLKCSLQMDYEKDHKTVHIKNQSINHRVPYLPTDNIEMVYPFLSDTGTFWNIPFKDNCVTRFHFSHYVAVGRYRRWYRTVPTQSKL